MAYYLMIKENEIYKNIDIFALPSFKRISNFKTGYSLEEIDRLTSQYKSEIELKKELYNNGLIDFEDIPKQISIRRKINKEYKKILYDPIYADKFKYLIPEYLFRVIQSYINDDVFLNKLEDKYRFQKRNFYIFEVANARKIKEQLEKTNKLTDALYKFMNEEIYEIDKLTGEIKRLKYKSLHDLATFTDNYVDKNNNEITHQKELLELQKEILLKEKIPQKRKVKTKKEQIEGQISFYDM